jgi:hypothetical protein
MVVVRVYLGIRMCVFGSQGSANGENKVILESFPETRAKDVKGGREE